MDHMFIMRLAALLFGGGIASCLFPENPGCHMSCSCCWYLQKQLSHMPLSRTGGGSCFRVSFPYFFVFLSKEGQKAERAEKSPALPSRYGRDNYQILLLVLQFPCLWRSRFRQDQIHRQTADGTVHQVRIRRFHL